MAVYERAYRAYAGPLTPERWRFLILPRYAFRDVFRSRLFTVFFAGCFLWPVACAVLIYLRHNVSALRVFDISKSSLFQIDAANTLNYFMVIQGSVLGFLIAFVVGPALVSPDLRNNALPLYLSRPLSRKEYIAGKMSVLVILLSAITWVPGLLLFFFHSYLEGWEWLRGNLRIAGAVVLGSWIWIAILSLLALTVSATVKWRPLASATLVAIFFIAAAMGVAFNAMFLTTWGNLIDIGEMVRTVWGGLFGVEAAMTVPVWAAWASLLSLCGLCLILLARRLRAYEVVR